MSEVKIYSWSRNLSHWKKKKCLEFEKRLTVFAVAILTGFWYLEYFLQFIYIYAFLYMFYIFLSFHNKYTLILY